MKKYLVSLLLVTAIVNPLYIYADEIVISENGSGSENIVSTQTALETTIAQVNNTQIQNTVSVDANTGGNTVSDTYANTSITTGDAINDTQVTNQANTNILINPCCEAKKEASEISGNGADSQNNINSTSINSNTYVSQNNATIKTTINGVVNTGKNKVLENLGSAKVITGDIYVSTSIKNGPINSSIVVLSDPNPNKVMDTSISKNGSGSKNTVLVKENFNNQIFIDNNSVILNDVIIDANTGGNLVHGNIGDVRIVTGNILTDLLISNNYINTSIISFTCCTEVIDNPSDPDPVIPTTPTNNELGSSNNSSSSSSSSGSTGGIGGMPILGLSNTSSGQNNIRFWIGFLCMVVGFGFLVESLDKNKSKKV